MQVQVSATVSAVERPLFPAQLPAMSLAKFPEMFLAPLPEMFLAPLPAPLPMLDLAPSERKRPLPSFFFQFVNLDNYRFAFI